MQEAEVLTSTLSGLVSTVEQELKKNNSSESLELQGEVDAPCISEETAAHLSEIDHEIALHRNSHESEVAHHAAFVHHIDERIDGFDQAIQELFRADNASKARHQSRSEKSSGGYTFVVPSLF